MKLLFLLLAGSLIGCSTMRESLVLGAGTGVATGAVTGAIMSSEHRGQGALIGALVGGAIGSISSYFIHKGVESRDEKVRRDTLFNLEKFNVSAPNTGSSDRGPRLSMPVVEGQWVDTQVQGKKLVEGHRVWVISEEPQWMPDQRKK